MSKIEQWCQNRLARFFFRRFCASQVMRWRHEIDRKIKSLNGQETGMRDMWAGQRLAFDTILQEWR
jgi:hypothetical protein